MTKKIRLGLLFGGQSAEHEISLQSARSIIENIDHKKYEVIPIGIDKQGSWNFLTVSEFLLLFKKEHATVFKRGEKSLALASVNAKNRLFSPCILRQNLDVIFPALHGPFGEDGTIQGLVRLANLPCVGSDVLGSALCMDKAVVKCLLRDANLPIPRFNCLKLRDPINVKNLIQEIGLPLFVKPSNLGSSIGISRVDHEEKLLGAIHKAFQYDEKVLIEEYIKGQEIECAVLGNLDPIASLPGEVIPQHEFYSYEAKYLDDEGALFNLPAKLDSKTIKRVQELAIRAFLMLECEGMARVDFFLSTKGKLFFNELNTIPGFTTISLYPKLWELSGISYCELVDQLIEFALERHKRKRGLQTEATSITYTFH